MRSSNNLDTRYGRSEARTVLLSQVAIGVVVAIASLAVAGAAAAKSALLGAGIGIAATTLMAFALLRHGAGASASRVAFGFFTGWLVKVVFTIAVLVLALRSGRVEALPLIVAYAATFVGYWVGAVRSGGRKTGQQFGVAD